MELSALQIVLIFLFSCICGMGSVLDEFQTHRPLIACTMVGLILGDVQTGIILGGTLELIALGWMNIGAAQSPDSALASVISTILISRCWSAGYSIRNCDCVASGSGGASIDGYRTDNHGSFSTRSGS